MILAMDLGGTKLQYGLFHNGPKPILHETAPTETDFIQQIKTIIRDLLASHAVTTLAIGVPGPTFGTTMQGSKPLNTLEDVDFASALEEFNLQLILNNDLNMAAHSELSQGVGRTTGNFCLVSLSTGIGVAVVVDGVVLNRRTEMGHQVFDADFSPPQACTNHQNCWASLASGNAIEKRFGTEAHHTTGAIFEHVLTEQNIQGIRQLNAQGLGNLVNAYDPEVIVMMGSLALKQFHSIIPLASELEPYTINRPIPGIQKCVAEDSIGMMGAYFAARASL